LAGQRVTFVEQDAQHQTHTIATARGAGGSLKFIPSPLLSEKRTILAEVTDDGQPREDDTVAHYTVAPPAPLPAPSQLGAKRAGSQLRIHWRGVTGADGYAVTVNLRDGTHRFVEVKHPGAMLAGFPPGTGATVAVRALAPGVRSHPGHTASVTIASTTRVRRVRVTPT
jgi:hypothetical protein